MTAGVQSFVLYGQQHLLALLIIFSLTCGVLLIVRKINSERGEQIVALSLAGVLLLGKVGEPIFKIVTGEPWSDVLPLHLCDIAGILTSFMLMSRYYFFYELTYFWGLGGCLQAILTPDLQNSFPHANFLFFFGSHGLVILGVLYATAVFKFRPTLKSIWRTFLTTIFYALVIFPVNWILNTNYLYLRHKPQNPSLLDYLGPWPWYILSLAVVGLVFFFIYYSPFWIADLIKRHRASKHI